MEKMIDAMKDEICLLEEMEGLAEEQDKPYAAGSYKNQRVSLERIVARIELGTKYKMVLNKGKPTLMETILKWVK